MPKSYTIATSFLPYTPSAQSEASAEYPAANVALVTRPRMLWRSTAPPHYIEADLGSAQSPTGFFVHNTNVSSWVVALSDTPGTGGDVLGVFITGMDPRTGRARGCFRLTPPTPRRYLRLTPFTFFAGAYGELGALAVPVLVDLDDYVGAELQWEPRHDILTHRYPGSGVQHEIRGPRYLVTRLAHDQGWVQAGSIQSQLLTVVGAKPGPILVWEAWRNTALHAYLCHASEPVAFREGNALFSAEIALEEYI